MRVDIRSEADFAKYQGKLKDKIVLPQGARRVRMLTDRVILRMSDADVAEALTTPIPEAATGGGGGGGGGGAAAGLAEKVAQFYVAEGVAALLERGSESDMSAGGSDMSWETQRVDGGTIFPGNGGSRDPKTPAQVPSATIAVEHYNRMVRVLEKGLPVRVELNIQTTFFPEAPGTPNGINTIAEIPGSDLADEVVIMGAHFDTHAGCHRRDRQRHRIGGDDGSGARHQDASGSNRAARSASRCGAARSRDSWDRAPTSPSTTAASPRRSRRTSKVAAYYNLDNGTGRIRGIWGQGNLGAMALFRQWIESVRDLGVDIIGPRSVGATDHASFDNAGHPRLPVRAGAARIQLAHAPLEHGFLRPRAARGSRAAGDRRRRVRVVFGELAGEAAAQGGGAERRSQGSGIRDQGRV